jgi:hypothetical protein
MASIFGETYQNDNGVLPSACIDRLSIKEQRELLLAWSNKLISHIEKQTKDAYENRTGKRVRHLISAFASCVGKI